jgi:hypothetical protein
MSDRPELSRYELLKWLLLDHAGANMELEMLFGVTRQALPEASEDEVEEVFRRAMLDLYDAGFLGFFRAGRPEGYNLELHEVEQLAREEIPREIDDVVNDVERADFTWVRETEEGAKAFGALPSETVAAARGLEEPEH